MNTYKCLLIMIFFVLLTSMLCINLTHSYAQSISQPQDSFTCPKGFISSESKQGEIWLAKHPKAPKIQRGKQEYCSHKRKKILHYREYWFDSSVVRATGTFKKGLRHGVWSYWYPSGTSLAKGTFEKDLPTGLWSFFDAKGALRAEGRFRSGYQHGLWHYFDQDTLKVGVYKKGKPQGEWVHSTLNKIQQRISYDTGKGIKNKDFTIPFVKIPLSTTDLSYLKRKQFCTQSPRSCRRSTRKIAKRPGLSLDQLIE